MDANPLYGVFLKLSGRRCIVVGGGGVAERKVSGLLECGADVQVIAPELSARLAEFAQGGKIAWQARTYQAGDLMGAFLVIAATDSKAVNQQVEQEAEQRGLLVNVVNDQTKGNLIVPAMVRRGPLQIGISTGGASPALAKQIREELEAHFGPEYGMLLMRMAEVRQTLLKTVLDKNRRAKIFQAFASASSDLLALLQKGQQAEAERLIANIMGGNVDEADCGRDS